MFRKKKTMPKDFDAQFEAFMKESISSEESSLDTARVAKYLGQVNNKKRDPQPWWMNGDDDSLSESVPGLSGTGKSFLKKVTKPEDNHKKQMGSTAGFEVDMSKDSLDDISLRGRDSVEMNHNGPSVPALALDSSHSLTETVTGGDKSHPGLETLQEMADKEQFFEDLQKNSDSTIDFSRLNRDLDKSVTLQGTLSSELGKGGLQDCRPEVDTEDGDDLAGIRTKSPSGTKMPYAQESEENKPSMLSKVALMDSLDSTLGTKYASQETRPDDMKPIPEGTERDEGDECDGTSRCRTKANSSQIIGSHLVDSHAMDKTASEPTAKGMTIKTGTGGFGYTDTSHEIEALQAALRQAGMSTMGSTRDFTLQESSSLFTGTGATPIGESRVITEGASDASGAFGLKPVAANVRASERTVDDIIHEVDELRKTDEGYENHTGVRFQSNSDNDKSQFDESHGDNQVEAHGFDLSPIHTKELQEEECGFDLSPVDKYANSHPFEDYESHSSSLPVPAPRLPKPASKKKAAKEKFPNVRSSGYGIKSTSPQRKASSAKDLSPVGVKKNSAKKPSWTPADMVKQKLKGVYLRTVQVVIEYAVYNGPSYTVLSKTPVNIKSTKLRSRFTGTEVLHKSGNNIHTVNSSDNQLVASVQSFANYIQTHFTESVDLSANDRLAPGVKFSQDEPLLSVSQKLGSHERERALTKEIKEWKDLWKEEQRMHIKLKADLDSIQREHDRKLEAVRLEHEADLFKLKQENFVLSAKVAEDEKEASARCKALFEKAGAEGISKEQVALLEKEIREQEGLLAGYQAENERLYQELKKMQTMSKTTEQQMFKENQRLTTEVSSLRQQLEQREIELQHRGLITSPAVQQQIAAGNMSSAVLGAGRIAQLDAELKQAKIREDLHKKEVEAAVQAKREVEKQVDNLVLKLTDFEGKVQQAKASQSQEAKVIEAKYADEIEKLNRRLKWYAENQELLDRDHQLLKKKDEEIKSLREKADHLTTEHGRRQAEAKARVKERAADAKKIQDLQRQVREMEGIIRKRHPNSLPVLMWAANAAIENHTDSTSSKPLSVKYLEERCKKLELEVDEKDEEAKKSLRVMEQKYNSMKYQYEDRIRTLELTLAKYERPGEGDHPHSHSVALQKELDSVRDRYKKQVAEQDTEIERLRKEVVALKVKEQATVRAETKASQDAEEKLQQRIRSLEGQLLEKDKEYASTKVSCERLQREKIQLETELARRVKRLPPASGSSSSRGSSSTDRSRRPRSASRTRVNSMGAGTTRKATSQESLHNSAETNSLSATTTLPPYPTDGSVGNGSEKDYEPGAFSGTHIEDVFKEREELLRKIEKLQLDVDQYRVNNSKLLAEAESRERRSSEHSEEQLSALKLSHQLEVQRLMTDHAMSHSTSRVAELQGRVDTQEVMIRHLKEQLSEAKVDSEQMATLKIRTTTLESQVTELLGELHEARKSHTPEMRHYMTLQDQIRKLEARHQRREHELQQIVAHAHSVAAADLEKESSKWRQLVDSKNREIEKFRAELDTILQVLHELQRQGVILPSASGSSAGGATGSSGSRYSDR